MSASEQEYNFDEYDKPGTERSRRRRGEDDDLESDLEEDLLEEDSPLGKKNLSEDEDEELNDALLQSDDEDLFSGQDVSLNATHSLDTSFDPQQSLQDADYSDDVVNLGTEDYEARDVEQGYQEEGGEEYTEHYSQDDVHEGHVDYTEDVAEDEFQDEVLDIQINELIDGDFQVENEGVPEEETKEDSDDEEDEDEGSGRIRFKSERKDSGIVRLADTCTKRRNIPETLELSEKAKKDLIEYEQQERQRRQNRYGGRGRGNFAGFGMHNMRGGSRGRMNDHMFHKRGNMGMQSSRVPLLLLPHQQPLHSQHLHHHHHHHQQQPSRPRGPPPFQEHGRPHAQQPLQPLIPPHMTHRSPPVQPQMEPPSRLMGSPPPSFPQHHNQQQQPPQLPQPLPPQPPQQPKNIHINPHFRGSAPSSVPVPLMPPAPSQPRPTVGPQRFPGPGDFHQHMPNNFGQTQRPPHHMEPFRNHPHQGPQDREPLFMGGPEHADPTHFPGQHMFDHRGPSSLLNANLHQQQHMPSQGHMGFGQPGPAFSQPGLAPPGLFPREPLRPGLPPPQGHQGMVGMNQQGPPPNQARPFMSPRQPFGQQGNLFPPPQAQFGLQGLIHGPPLSQPPHQDPLPAHQPIHQPPHRQELLHHQQPQQLNLNEPPPLLHHGQNLFHQQHGSPRQGSPRLQNLQQRNMSNRQRMNTPVSKPMHPQRNSNLRELPVAPGNTNMNSSRPTGSLATNVRPVAKATQGVRPMQSAQTVPGSGRGRGQVAAKTPSLPGAMGRTVVCKEVPSSTAPQDPDEDEETRQYRMKLEEQKRLREEILKKKELRRQMQAGVRKKELLDRINTQTPTQSLAPSQNPPSQQNQPAPPSIQHPAIPPLQQPQEQRQLQQQRQRTQQSLNQINNPNQGNPNGMALMQTHRPNVKARLQMVKGNNQQPQTPILGPDQQWRQPPRSLQQQRRTSGLQNANKPGTPNQFAQAPLNSIPVTSSLGPGQPQAQGLKPGAKRTVMQRAKLTDSEGQQVPQKVRVVKLSGGPGKGPEAMNIPMQHQQQGAWSENPLKQGIQRNITMAGQQTSQGVMGHLQHNRVVVSGQGRGRGGAHMGRGGPIAARQGQKVTENQRRTVTIEGLSSSTSDVRLQSLLRSIGPIEMFRMIPQQRKAIATFSSPQHAASFQMSFHRHMIDLSHIDVKLIDG
ncbi:RNA-binding protein 33 isoform X2 [Dunckerocampus dactyliophorus]|uniref:RNA-binding protein 33 isoform X2 n=1 Tax=Dunckerocampus dactyliophorus TaxID=161453 RepID=UPI002406433B|nr:RNA-binding protein 33 isoform X2 [Dunckerocampus dactyliophorus]